MRAIGKQGYRLLASGMRPVLMSTTRIVIQIVQIYLTVQIWARTGSNSRALCRVTACPYPPRNYAPADMARCHAGTARQRGKRVGIQSPNLRPKAGFQFPTMQITKPLLKIRIFVFADATAHATSLWVMGFNSHRMGFNSHRINRSYRTGYRCLGEGAHRSVPTCAVHGHPGGFPFTSR